MRDSTVFYRSFYDGIKAMPKKMRLELFEAVFDYTFYDVQPELEGMTAALFSVMKPQIDANNERYENGKKGAEYGKRGGRPKKETPMGIEEKTPMGLSAETPNKNVNVNVNGNVNVNAEMN